MRNFPITDFKAGTLIPTAAGLKPIEEIKVGDYVVVPSPERN